MESDTLKILENTLIPEALFESVKTTAEELYACIPAVSCPYFKGVVNFNVKGLDHLKFKAWNRARSRKDQYVRFKFLRLVPQALELSATLQGYSEEMVMVRKKNYGSRSEILMKVKYYEFVYVHREKVRIKIIVKQEGDNGDRYFYSIIPFWKMSSTGEKIISTGNPKED